MSDTSQRFPRPTGGAPGNSSPIGRLLEEISWEGNAKPYRDGGRGRENVPTTEVFLALDYLPRSAFMGAMLRAATGADDARSAIARELESATVEWLPGDIQPLGAAGTSVSWKAQLDVLIESRGAVCLVGVKRIRSSTFQVKQVPRMLVALDYVAQGRGGLVLLVVAEPPPRLQATAALDSHRLWRRKRDLTVTVTASPSQSATAPETAPTRSDGTLAFGQAGQAYPGLCLTLGAPKTTSFSSNASSDGDLNQAQFKKRVTFIQTVTYANKTGAKTDIGGEGAKPPS